MYREYRIGSRRMKIFLGDITDLQVDAIVNSENNDLIMDRRDGPSVSAAIRRRSADGFAETVAGLGPIPLGKAVMTQATGSLRCRYVIHAAVVRRRSAEEHETEPSLLRSSVRSSLELAAALGMKSVAFPAFGVRAAQVPKEVSSDLMIEEVTRMLEQETSLEEVIFALLDPESFLVFFERAIIRHVEYSAPIELTVSQRPHGIEMRLQEGGPVASRDFVKLKQDLLKDVALRFEALQSAAQRQLIDAEQLLRSLGGFLWNFFLPPRIREGLSESRAANLLLRIDESLQGLPLELAWDGQACLNERFRIGRQVAANVTPSGRYKQRRASHLTIFCDSHCNLPGAHQEGVALFRMLGDKGVAVELRGGKRASRANLLALLPDTSILHWSGHGQPQENGGPPSWLLSDGLLEPSELTGPVQCPSLVFSNACALDPQGLLGQGRLEMGQAFLRMGARHFIGSLWEIDDRASRHFALAFYQALLDDRDTGDALRAARAAVKEQLGDRSVDWAAYVHFGDPRENPLKASQNNH